MNATKLTAQQLEALKVGDIIAKYPIDGEPVSEIDFQDKKQLSIYKIVRIPEFDDIIELAPSSLSWGAEIASLRLDIGTLKKDKSGLVNDERWWLISNN